MSRAGLGLRLIVSGAAVVVTLAVAEVVLALAGLPRDPDTQIVATARADGTFDVLCGSMTGEDIHALVARAKPLGSLRVVFVGDSTIHGFVLAAKSTIPRLFEALIEPLIGRDVDIVNLGAPGIDARRVAALGAFAAESLAPDLVIAYTGHNEFLPASSEPAIARLQIPLPRRVITVLEQTHVGTLILRALTPAVAGGLISQGSTAPATWIEPSSRNAPIRGIVLERFSRTLDAFATALAARRVPLVFVLPVSDGREYGPIQSAFSRALDASMQSQYRDRVRAAAEKANAGDVAGAAADVEWLKTVDPDVAILRHVEAQIAWARGDETAGRALNLEAWGLDENGRAASNFVMDRIRTAGAEHGDAVVDFRAALERPPRAAEPPLFFDHCHPTVFGQVVFASELAVAIAPLLAPGLDGAGPGALRARLPSPQRACELAGVSVADLAGSGSLRYVGDLLYALTAPDPAPFLERVRAVLKDQDPQHPTLPNYFVADLVLALFDGDRDRAQKRSVELVTSDPPGAAKLRALILAVDRLRTRLDELGLRMEADGRLARVDAP